MTSETPDASVTDEGHTRRPGLFRNRFNAPRLLPDAQQRQGRISSAAFLALGRDEAVRFLNSPDERLGGRPLAVATASDDGFAQVIEAIHRIADRRAAQDAAQDRA